LLFPIWSRKAHILKVLGRVRLGLRLREEAEEWLRSGREMENLEKKAKVAGSRHALTRGGANSIKIVNARAPDRVSAKNLKKGEGGRVADILTVR
jgi:hypothetical protein